MGHQIQNYMIENIINLQNVTSAFSKFKGAAPFDHCIVDNFFNPEIADQLSNEFIPYDDPDWNFYNNLIENKKACNNWNKFPQLTYKTFYELNDTTFLNFLSNLFGEKLYSDPGLHGGGWHCHGTGGLLNPHFDYSIHPKISLQRILNIIVYLGKELKEEHGGHLGLWSHNNNQPDQLIKEVEPVFNRAVIFNTAQNSWHGMSRPLTQPEGIYRKSLAVYYLKEPDIGIDTRGRALFAPTKEQKNNQQIIDLINLRSGVETSKNVYRQK